jgi:hypothetical protein
MMRFSIVGTTTSTSTRWRSIRARVSSASKTGGSTTVHPSAVAIVYWPSPCAWNSGAGIRHTEPASIGTTLRNQASGSRPEARAIRAPLGAPVVPDVRITMRPSSGGGSSGVSSSPSRSFASPAPVTTRFVPAGVSPSSSGANSSS